MAGDDAASLRWAAFDQIDDYPMPQGVNETIRQVQAFQLIRESKGAEATPSGWRPGKATLKPGIDLVGKVWKKWKVEQAFD